MKYNGPILATLCYSLALAIGALSATVTEDQSLLIALPGHKGLKFLGVYVRYEMPRGNNGVGLEARQASKGTLTASTYMISTEKHTYPEARENCPNLTNRKGTLVKIETKEEDQKIQDFIIEQAANKQLPEIFWTDGVSNKFGDWKWNSNGAEIKDYTHFGIKAGPGGLLGFKSISEDREDFEWLAIYDRNERHYYICEIEPEPGQPSASRPTGDVHDTNTSVPPLSQPLPTPPPTQPTPTHGDGLGAEATPPPPAIGFTLQPCDEQTNLAIVVDHMTTTSGPDLGRVNEFAAKLASAFPSPSRVFFFGYDDISQTETPEAKAELVTPTPEGRAYVTRISQPRGAADLGITRLSEISTHHLLSRMVVLTNGKIKIENLATKQAERARIEHITVFTIGIGPGVDSKELLTLAGGKQENVFALPDFESLGSKVEQINRLVCQPNA